MRKFCDLRLLALLSVDCGAHKFLSELLDIDLHRTVDDLGHEIVLGQCLLLDVFLHQHAREGNRSVPSGYQRALLDRIVVLSL